MKHLFLIIAFLSLVATGYAQEGDPLKPPEPPCCPKMQMMMDKLEMLGLNPEQLKQIEAVRMAMRKDIIPLKAELEMKQIDLETEMKAEKPERDKIMKLLKEISDLELKIKQINIDEKLKIHSILTPEQREKMRMPMHKFMMKCKEKCEK